MEIPCTVWANPTSEALEGLSLKTSYSLTKLKLEQTLPAYSVLPCFTSEASEASEALKLEKGF
jgi:hypothetical protein